MIFADVLPSQCPYRDTLSCAFHYGFLIARTSLRVIRQLVVGCADVISCMLSIVFRERCDPPAFSMCWCYQVHSDSRSIQPRWCMLQWIRFRCATQRGVSCALFPAFHSILVRGLHASRPSMRCEHGDASLHPATQRDVEAGVSARAKQRHAPKLLTAVAFGQGVAAVALRHLPKLSSQNPPYFAVTHHPIFTPVIVSACCRIAV